LTKTNCAAAASAHVVGRPCALSFSRTGELPQLTGCLGSFLCHLLLAHYLRLVANTFQVQVNQTKTIPKIETQQRLTRFVAGCRSLLGDIITSWLVDTDPTGVDCKHTKKRKQPVGISMMNNNSRQHRIDDSEHWRCYVGAGKHDIFSFFEKQIDVLKAVYERK
jgi:hypothetical protein